LTKFLLNNTLKLTYFKVWEYKILYLKLSMDITLQFSHMARRVVGKLLQWMVGIKEMRTVIKLLKKGLKIVILLEYHKDQL
jgi:hypothetical protein